MTYQQAGRIAILKRIAGWVIFIPTLISSLISMLKFAYADSETPSGSDAVIMDFIHAVVGGMQESTPFLNVFWYNSPQPDFHGGLNIAFWIIFALMFIALAMQDSGARMSRQAKYLREGVNDQLILEKAKGEKGLSREALEARVVVPHNTIFVQFFPLYILPIVVIVVGYFVLKMLGFL